MNPLQSIFDKKNWVATLGRIAIKFRFVNKDKKRNYSGRGAVW